MEQHEIALLQVAVERERQVDDRVLQPLAHPHSHDLDGGSITVDPSIPFGCTAALSALSAQPVPKRRQGVVLAVRGLLQQLRQVCQVCHMSLAAVPRQHAVAHAAQLRGLQDRSHPALAGVVRPLPQGFGYAIGQRMTFGSKAFRGLTEEHRGGGGAHHAGAVRLVERFQE